MIEALVLAIALAVGYACGCVCVWIGNVMNPVWEPMSWRTKLKLALLWPWHLVNEEAYSETLWEDYDR